MVVPYDDAGAQDDGQEPPVDYDFGGVAFAQTAGRQLAAAMAQAASNYRKTLDVNKLYLDTCSAFNQAIQGVYLTNIGPTKKGLRAGCNAGISKSNQKGMLLDAIDMWLVESGIANLLSVGWLERHNWHIAYKTGTAWKVTSPGGLQITFRRDVGGLDGFLFVDLREQGVQNFFAQVAAERTTARN